MKDGLEFSRLARWGWAFQAGRGNGVGCAKAYRAKMLSCSRKEQDVANGEEE